MGRQVINILSSDVVSGVGGRKGTVSDFAIARRGREWIGVFECVGKETAHCWFMSMAWRALLERMLESCVADIVMGYRVFVPRARLRVNEPVV